MQNPNPDFVGSEATTIRAPSIENAKAVTTFGKLRREAVLNDFARRDRPAVTIGMCDPSEVLAFFEQARG